MASTTTTPIEPLLPTMAKPHPVLEELEIIAVSPPPEEPLKPLKITPSSTNDDSEQRRHGGKKKNGEGEKKEEGERKEEGEKGEKGSESVTSPPRSPIIERLEMGRSIPAVNDEPVELYSEMEDTGVQRTIAPPNLVQSQSQAPIKAPIDDVTVLIAEDVVLTPGERGLRMEYVGFDEGKGEGDMQGGGIGGGAEKREKGLGVKVREDLERVKQMKLKDPAIMIEIPGSPSAQAYEVAHTNKLDDRYFDPLYEDLTKSGAVTPLPPAGTEGTAEKVMVDTVGNTTEKKEVVVVVPPPATTTAS